MVSSYSIIVFGRTLLKVLIILLSRRNSIFVIGFVSIVPPTVFIGALKNIFVLSCPVESAITLRLPTESGASAIGICSAIIEST